MEEYQTLRPSEGNMLYNGQIYSDCVYLGRLDKAENWREVPLAEYEAWMAAQELPPEGSETPHAIETQQPLEVC